MTAEAPRPQRNETCNLYQVGQSGRNPVTMFLLAWEASANLNS